MQSVVGVAMVPEAILEKLEPMGWVDTHHGAGEGELEGWTSMGIGDLGSCIVYWVTI